MSTPPFTIKLDTQFCADVTSFCGGTYDVTSGNSTGRGQAKPTSIVKTPKNRAGIATITNTNRIGKWMLVASKYNADGYPSGLPGLNYLECATLLDACSVKSLTAKIYP